ncbi:hypothetical protein EAF04_005822 [Stromatinia cepivora]|nr:hypothetical protein EAF04_005822 [Stromatinia cepivora]
MTNTSKKRRLCDNAPENINLQQFLLRRSNLQQWPKKTKLTSEAYEINIEKLNGNGPLTSKDTDATKENITDIYCKWKKDYYNISPFKQLYNRINGRYMDMNDAKEVFKYLDTILAKEFILKREKTVKPVLGVDDLILLFIHHWVRDTSIFPIEDQRLAFTTIIFLLIYTGCRPAELVDAGKVKSAIDYDQTYEDNNWDKEYEGLDDTKDDDPIYKNPELWVDSKVSDCDDKDDEEEVLIREYKALCYEDIRLRIVRNPTPGERDLLGMEITLVHHKGADRKPKPTTFLFHEETLPILCPVSYILAIAIRDNTIKVNGFTYAEPFFVSNL